MHRPDKYWACMYNILKTCYTYLSFFFKLMHTTRWWPKLDMHNATQLFTLWCLFVKFKSMLYVDDRPKLILWYVSVLIWMIQWEVISLEQWDLYVHYPVWQLYFSLSTLQRSRMRNLHHTKQLLSAEITKNNARLWCLMITNVSFIHV